MKNSIQRRNFLKGLLTTAALLGLNKLDAIDEINQDDILNRSFVINPAYTGYTSSSGELILETQLPGGKIQFIQCAGLEKDVFQLIREKSILSEHLFTLAEKHQMTQKDVIKRSTLLIEKLCKEGILITKDSKINVIQNETQNAGNK